MPQRYFTAWIIPECNTKGKNGSAITPISVRALFHVQLVYRKGVTKIGRSLSAPPTDGSLWLFIIILRFNIFIIICMIYAKINRLCIALDQFNVFAYPDRSCRSMDRAQHHCSVCGQCHCGCDRLRLSVVVQVLLTELCCHDSYQWPVLWALAKYT